jgi:AcrR family transcriptional regulator
MAKRAGAKKAAKAARTTRKPHARAARSPVNDGDPSAAALRRALLALIEERGWLDLSLADIAEKAGLSLTEAHRIYPSKAAMLVGLAKAADERVLAGLEGNPLEGSAKDRLFDLLMRRFDVLKADRAAYRRLIRQLPATPAEFAALLCRLRRSLSLMLEAAGVSASGFRGEIRLQGMWAIYTAAMRAFVNDESDDLAKTMAEVDKRLGQAERFSDMLSRRKAAA